MGCRLLRKTGLAAAACAAALLATGCSSTGPPGMRPAFAPAPEEEVGEDGGGGHAFGSLLPDPFGTLTFREDPVVFVLGWTGMIAGGLAGGVLVVAHTNYDGTEEDDGLLIGGILAGAFVGGCILALPVRGLEELGHQLAVLWRRVFHTGADHPEPVLESGP